MAAPDPALPIVDDTMRRLTKGQGGVYLLTEKAVAETGAQLGQLKGKPEYQKAMRQLAMLAYMLSEKKKSKAASQAIMGLLTKAVGVTKPPAGKPAGGGGWGAVGAAKKKR